MRRRTLVVVLIALGLTQCGTNAPPAPQQPTLISISVAPAGGSYQVSSTQQFTATGHYSDGSSKDFTQTAIWSSSSDSVATVSNTAGSQGMVKMVGVGSAEIVASMTLAQGSASITVTNPLTSMDITPGSGSYQVGTSLQFTATGYYGDGSSKEITQSVNWSSSNTSVATVSNSSGSQGMVTMVGSGSASIVATLGSVQASASASVSSPVTISVSPTFASVTVTHQTASFGATVQGTTDTGVTWLVDGVDGGNSTVGTISSAGLYTPPGTKGFHTISAISQADLGKSATAQAAVMDNPGVFTRQYDNARAGQDTDEIVLTPQNVNQKQFGKLFSYPVDGNIYAQPLYVANVNIPGEGYHNVVYVATTNDTVYAFDADNQSGGAIWQKSLINSSAGETAAACNQLPANFCGFAPTVGITGTPVIDPATGTLYVDALSEIGGTFYHKLHALDIATGAEKFGGPVTLQATVPGAGDGTDGTSVAFQAQYELQRPGLLLANGNIYVGFASYGDSGPYHGWVLAYNATTLQQAGVFNDTPDGYQGGIWQGGGGISADADGNIYVVSGNGKFDANTGGRDYGDSIIKLSADLSQVESYFTPYNQAALDSGDLDLGSTSPLLLPDQSGPYLHLLVADGKIANIYVVNRDSMGGYQAGSNSQIVQYMPGGTSVVMTSPAYWNSRVYFADQASSIKAFAVSDGRLSASPQVQPIAEPAQGITVSANGSQDGILWTIQPQTNPITAALLVAYDATNVTSELYDSNQAGTRDVPGNWTTFQPPVVINGKVYVGARGELDVYGLLPQ